MPASLRYTWEESDDSITVTIPFKGKSLNKTDVYCSDLVIKVSYSNFLLQLDLVDFVIPTSLQAAVKKNDNLIIYVAKTSKGQWKSLTFDGTKAETNERRKESMRRRTLELQEMHEKSQSKKIEEGRVTLRNQMALDKAEMQHIDNVKNQEKKMAEDAMYETMSRLDNGQQHEPNDFSDTKSPKALEANNQVSLTTKDSRPSVPSSVRAPTIVKFKHTPRAFKTPIRESTQLQEKAFLAKNRPYLKANHYFNSESSVLAESDPTWLQHKGDEFLKAGDHLSAINVYSTIIDKDPTFLRAYTSRSACYLLIEEPSLCIHDCSHALKMMNFRKDPDIDSDMKSLRVEILIRVASAHCQFDTLHHYQLALGYLKDAVMIDESNKSLAIDIQQLEGIIGAHEHKRDGDIAFGRNELEAAIDFYSKAILMEKSLLKAYSNRSAVYLLIGKYESCINDCSLVLDILKTTKKSISCNSATFVGSVPLTGTDVRKDLVRTCIQKRAVAYSKIKKFDLATKNLVLAETLFGGGNKS